LFEVEVFEGKEQGRTRLRVSWRKREGWSEWARRSEGHYLLRTNLMGWTAENLWKTYIQLTQAESAFRVQKSELRIRPIWHQLQKRVQAHILFSFLAYAMWKTLQMWMARSGLGDSPRTLLQELAKIKVVDVILPTSAGRELRVRCVSAPDKPQQVLLSRLGLQIPRRLGQPRWQSVVRKLGSPKLRR
jgi:transposase